MGVYLCHEQPDLLEFEAAITDSRPGAVVLERSAFHPGGGGQVSDIGTLEHGGGIARVTGIEIAEDGRWWHLLDQGDLELSGTAGVRIDAAHRDSVSQLHTVTHICNALVFDHFDGALVTGAQINGDGTARMDFDLPDADNDRLRALEPAINDAIARGLPVRAIYVDLAEAERTPGLIRSLSVTPPPTPDGRLRIIEIEGLDRQACGGTHVTDTAAIGRIQIVKVENKGRRNRRVRVAFA